MSSERDKSLWAGGEGHAIKIQRFNNLKIQRFNCFLLDKLFR